MKQNLEQYIINKFYKKRVLYTDEDGKTKEKKITKSSAKEIAKAIFIIDPTDNKKFTNALSKTFLNDNSKFFNWIIGFYYSNDKESKHNLKELYKSLQRYYENIELFDPYEQNLNNFSDVIDFINTVDNYMMNKNNKEEKEQKINSKKQNIHSKKDKLNVLKGSDVKDGLVLLGTVNLDESDFLGIYEFQEIKDFHNNEIDYIEYFNDHEISMSSEKLNDYINHLTKDNKVFYKFCFDIIVGNNGMYSIIDIEEEINETSINSITSFDEFIESISVEAIFQYLSEFLPDVYEFFELSIIAGTFKEIKQRISDLLEDIDTDSKITLNEINTRFILKSNDMDIDVFIHPTDTTELIKKDVEGELTPEQFYIQEIDDSDLASYVVYKYLKEYQDDINKIIHSISSFSDGKVENIDYDKSLEYIKEKMPELKQKFIE